MQRRGSAATNDAQGTTHAEGQGSKRVGAAQALRHDTQRSEGDGCLGERLHWFFPKSPFTNEALHHLLGMLCGRSFVRPDTFPEALPGAPTSPSYQVLVSEFSNPFSEPWRGLSLSLFRLPRSLVGMVRKR